MEGKDTVEMVITEKRPGKRTKLMEKRADLTQRIAAIDRALDLLDRNPDVEELADAMETAFKSEY